MRVKMAAMNLVEKGKAQSKVEKRQFVEKKCIAHLESGV
jgi:hypothetical protein